MKDAVSKLVCSSAAMTVYKILCFKTLNLKPYGILRCVNFLLEKQNSSAYLYYVGTLLPL